MAHGRSKKVVVPNRGGMAFGRNLMVLALISFRQRTVLQRSIGSQPYPL